MALTYDTAKRRYRDTESGRLLTRKQALALRDEVADVYGERFRALTRQYGEGTISRTFWERGFRGLITEASSAGYAFGRGGLALMTDADFDGLLRIVAVQLDFGEQFFVDARTKIEIEREGKLVRDIKRALLPQWEARAEMYGGSAVHGYERGHAAAVSDGGLGDLPVYPADGDTPCKSRCRCEWDITERPEERVWACVWITEGDDRVCDGCRGRRARYNPLLVPMEAQ